MTIAKYRPLRVEQAVQSATYSHYVVIKNTTSVILSVIINYCSSYVSVLATRVSPRVATKIWIVKKAVTSDCYELVRTPGVQERLQRFTKTVPPTSSARNVHHSTVRVTVWLGKREDLFSLWSFLHSISRIAVHLFA